MWQTQKGEQDTDEFEANTDANHTCTKFVWIFLSSSRYIYIFDAKKKGYVFVLRKFPLLHKLEKEDYLTSASAGYMSTPIEPNQMIVAILIDQ